MNSNLKSSNKDCESPETSPSWEIVEISEKWLGWLNLKNIDVGQNKQ